MITAIIVNYNSGLQLTACVASLLASSVPVNVVVSDNASTDDSLARLAAFLADDERITVVRNRTNLGFSAGCNIGLPYVDGDYALFINPDCVVPPDALERMQDIMEASPEVGMAGCLIRNPDGSEQVGCRRYIPTPWRALMRVLRLHRLFPEQPLFRTFNLHGEPLPEEPQAVEAISGAFMFVRMQALAQVGPLDDGYFLHCEDLDWCVRFTRQGHTVLFVPDVEVMHLKGGSEVSALFVEWHKHRGMIRFYGKFLRQHYSWLMRLAVMLAVGVRFALLVPWLLWQRHAGLHARSSAGERENTPPLQYLARTAADRADHTVIVCGASSQIGRFLLPRLSRAGLRVIALSRKGAPNWEEGFAEHVYWLRADIHQPDDLHALPPATRLIHLAPLVALTSALPVFADLGIRRVIAFSTSSRISKAKSPIAAERQFATQLAAAETALSDAGRQLNMDWTIFRPTLIYGCDMDRNITLIRRMIQRFGFFPLLGEASGLRQPVHADDLASACVAALESPSTYGKYYELSGGETLSYRVMVERIFARLGRRARFVRIPVALFAAALHLLSFIPRYRDFNVAMAQRMNEDLVYDHAAATRDFAYQPRRFIP